MEADLILVAFWCAVHGDSCRSSGPKEGVIKTKERANIGLCGSERTGRKSGVRRKPIISSTSDATAVRRDGSDATLPAASRSAIPHSVHSRDSRTTRSSRQRLRILDCGKMHGRSWCAGHGVWMLKTGMGLALRNHSGDRVGDRSQDSRHRFAAAASLPATNSSAIVSIGKCWAGVKNPRPRWRGCSSSRHNRCHPESRRR